MSNVGRPSRARIVAEGLEPRLLLSFGELETSFSLDGRQISNLGGVENASAVVVQPDGKVIVAGTGAIGNLPDFVMQRFNANGTPDLTFGGGDSVVIDLLGGDDFCTDIALQADGKILLVGYTNFGAVGANDTIVTRYNADGSFDNTFGVNHVARIDFNFVDDRGSGIAVAGGSIYVGATTFVGASDDFAVAKLTSAGTLDNTFSGDGKTSLTFLAADVCEDIAVQSDGKVILAGYTNQSGSNNMAVARLTAAGETDATFDGDGLVQVNYDADERAFGVAVDPFGRIVLAGQWDGGLSDFAVARLTSTGALDAGFGGGFFGFGSGRTNTTFGPGAFGGEERARDVAVLPNGYIQVGGFTDADVFGTATNPGVYNFAAARFTSDGGLDPTFDGDGRRVVDFGASDQAFGMAVTQDASVVLAGTTAGADFAIARFRGSLDIPLSQDGRQTLDFGNTDTANAVVVQPDGKLVVAGSWDGGSSDFAVARYNPDGSLDNSFGFGFYGAGSGRSNLTFGTGLFGGAEFATDVALQSDGRIVVVGYTNNVNGVPTAGGNDFAIARLNADGSPDNTFSGDGKFTYDFGFEDVAMSVVIQPDGKIVVAGYDDGGSPNFAIIRLNSNGTLDTSFNFDGAAEYSFGAFDFCDDVALDAQGRIVMVGQTNVNAGTTGVDLAALRLRPDGSLDPTFGTGGFFRLNTESGHDEARAVLIDPDGAIFLAGVLDFLSGFADFMVVKLTPAGALDGAFGFGGVATVALGQEDVGTDLVRQFDGKLVVGGYSSYNVPAAANSFAAVRFNPDGAFDTTFQPAVDPFATGEFRQRFGAAADNRGLGMAMQADGRIVMAGTADGDFAVLRLRPNVSIVDAAYLFNPSPSTSLPRISVRFSDDVLASVAAADFTLTNTTTAQVIPSGQLSLTLVPATNTVLIRYTGTSNGALPDGNYSLTLAANRVLDAAGNNNDQPQTFRFFVLAGDANRDRTVNLADFGILRANFGGVGKVFSQGDFNYDGTVNLADFGILRSRFGTFLPPTGGNLFGGGGGGGDESGNGLLA